MNRAWPMAARLTSTYLAAELDFVYVCARVDDAKSCAVGMRTTSIPTHIETRISPDEVCHNHGIWIFFVVRSVYLETFMWRLYKNKINYITFSYT